MTAKMKAIFLLLVIASFDFACYGSERDVFHYIFDEKKYDNRIRPVKDTNTTTYVGTQFQIISLLEVNGQQEYVTMAVFFKLNWTDEYLTWNPADFGGTEYIRAHVKEVWTPNFAIVSTSLEASDFISKEEQLVGIDNFGNVDYSFPIVLTNSCPMESKDFPFDKQTCIVKVTSWKYTSRFVSLAHVPMSSTAARNPNTEWEIMPFWNQSFDLTREGAGEDGAYRQVHYYIPLIRKSTYYVWVIMVPTFIISALSIAGIFGPFSNSGDREEKVTLGLTTLLTVSVILSLVTEEMPKGTNLPILGLFLLLELVICSLSVAIALVITYSHERAVTRSWPIPELFMFCFKQKLRDSPKVDATECGNISKRNLKKKNSIQIRENDINGMNGNTRTLEDRLNEISMWLRKAEEEETRKIGWIIIFDRIDMACLIFFELVNIANIARTLAPK